MVESYAATYTEMEYPYDKIEEDIIYNYIGTKNREHMLKTGFRKYYTDWVDEENPTIGKYPVLYVYEYAVEDKEIKPILRMKIYPVDGDGNIVQTKEHKKKHERIIRTIQMEDDMMKAGIKIREARTLRKRPNFQPNSTA